MIWFTMQLDSSKQGILGIVVPQVAAIGAQLGIWSLRMAPSLSKHRCFVRAERAPSPSEVHSQARYQVLDELLSNPLPNNPKN